MSMLNEPDWHAAESVLINEAKKTIEDYVSNYGNEVCSFFAFSTDYCFGDVAICFDTLDNSLLYAKRHDRHVLKTRASVFQTPNGWLTARDVLLHSKLCTYNPQTADFKYATFASLRLPDWEDFFCSGELPEQPDPVGNVIVVLHNVIEELIAFHSFDALRMSAPFRVGIEFPRDDFGLVVMRLLNWPSHEGPRV